MRHGPRQELKGTDESEVITKFITYFFAVFLIMIGGG